MPLPHYWADPAPPTHLMRRGDELTPEEPLSRRGWKVVVRGDDGSWPSRRPRGTFGRPVAWVAEPRTARPGPACGACRERLDLPPDATVRVYPVLRTRPDGTVQRALHVVAVYDDGTHRTLHDCGGP